MTTATPMAIMTGIAMPVGICSPPGGIGIPLLDGVLLGERRWPHVAVGDPDGGDDGDAADDADGDVRPPRSDREPVAAAAAAARDEAVDDVDDGDPCRPASSASRRARPAGPPPRSWNVVSSGAMVWPSASWKAKPRQTSRPPRVTMNDGTPMYATMKPCRPPISRAERRARRRPRRSRCTADRDPSPRVFGIHSACNRAMNMAVKTTIDPIDRSMLRDTMIRTMPGRHDRRRPRTGPTGSTGSAATGTGHRTGC